MVVCASTKCSNSSRIKQLRFFKFPSDDARRKVWITNAGLDNEPGAYAKLCETHFEEGQFELHRKDGWKKLKPNAIPTFFPEPIESTRKKKRARSPSSDAEVDVDTPRKSSGKLKFSFIRKKSTKRNASKNSAENSPSKEKENVLPRRRKGRPRKVCKPEPESSDTEIEEIEVVPKETEQEKEIATLRKENESMRQEIQEFEKHNKAMTRVIMELEKHNKAMSIKLIEMDKDNKVMTRKLLDMEKQNEDLRSKLNCCFSEEQFARMEKLMALGKIERYIPGLNK